MTSKEATSRLSPTITQWIERPMSRFSAASETTTFYSALDSPLSPNMSSNSIVFPDFLNAEPHLQKKKPSRRDKHTQESGSPELSRQDSGYAAHTSSALSSLKTLSPKLRQNAKRSSKTQMHHKNRRSPQRKISSIPQLSDSQQYIDSSPTQPHHQRSSFNDTRPKHLLERRKYFSELSTFTQSKLYNVRSFSSENNASFTNSSPPFPPTINYWTSDDSRRLEYAAIDAASKGVRGFLVRIVPDFILPPQVRRTRFWGHESEGKQREGSVRRYRLALPEESDEKWTKKSDQKYLGSWNKGRKSESPGILRKWSAGLRSNRV
ncbi:hypothetical protein OnM2_055046 [Erysiphe neolycopersici]|uniref:Uncharacterized protein n=1 Tax=Erysiphe neolycopersici TaxID=212602 RepID=A0A420HRH5_9PEZI|nr:hypothetical protein OnM2_055046 [Erysiphe neolycopersici]